MGYPLERKLEKAEIKINKIKFTFGSACEPEGHEGPDNSEEFHSHQGVDFPCVGVWSDQFQDLSSGDENLLSFGPREVPVDGMGDGRRTLQSEVIQKHRGALQSTRVYYCM